MNLSPIGTFAPLPNAFCTAEFALVVACCAWPLDAARVARITDRGSQVDDWALVADIIDRHRVAGLVNHALVKGGVILPAPHREALNERARDNAAHELQLAFETVRLAGALEAAGIAVVVLKGAATANSVFGQFGLRYGMDIDLLVAKDKIAAATALLEERGYVRTDPPQGASAAKMRARMARYKDLAFTHPNSDILIELHWRLFQNPFLMADAARDVTRMPLLPGTDVSVLDEETALLYLFVHGAEHGWARLKWLADVAGIISARPDLAEQVYAMDRGLRRRVGPAIMLCHRFFGTPVPHRLARDLARDWRMRWLLRNAYANLVGAEDGVELEDTAQGATAKNLGHYLMSNDARFWLSEILYDLLSDSSDAGAANGSRLFRIAGRFWAMATRRAVYSGTHQRTR